MANASYYVIYYEKFRKVMQRTEKEALSYEAAVPPGMSKPLSLCNVSHNDL